MKSIENKFNEMLANVPDNVKREISLESAVSNKIVALMKSNGLSKKELACQMGKSPSEITKWISGQHNFTLRTIAEISAFFDKQIIKI